MFVLCLYRGSKLTMLLRESLSHASHTTVVAQVSDSPQYLLQTIPTIQLASRIHRKQKRSKVCISISCSAAFCCINCTQIVFINLSIYL